MASPIKTDTNKKSAKLVVDITETVEPKRKAKAKSRNKASAEQSKKALKVIQDMFKDDKVWESEEAMLKDMAEFRRKRLNL